MVGNYLPLYWSALSPIIRGPRMQPWVIQNVTGQTKQKRKRTLRIVWRDKRTARRVLLGRNISRRREQSTVSEARGILKIQTGRYCPCNLGVTRGLRVP